MNELPDLKLKVGDRVEAFGLAERAWEGIEEKYALFGFERIGEL